MIGLAKKMWIPLVIVVVVVIAGFTVHRVRTFFGSEGIIVTPKVFADDPEPFDPKVVTYEIFGPGSLRRHQLPRSRREAAARRRRRAAVVAQVGDDRAVGGGQHRRAGRRSTITCRIIVDDEVKDERTSNGLNAQTFCIVKSA